MLGWGLYPYSSDSWRGPLDKEYAACELLPNLRQAHFADKLAVDGKMIFERGFLYQSYYDWGSLPTPEEQFVSTLIKRRERQLRKLDISDLKGHDITIKLTMPFAIWSLFGPSS